MALVPAVHLEAEEGPGRAEALELAAQVVVPAARAV
jgi:hypothetical protein